MAQGKKTGGRQKGTPNKPNPVKESIRQASAAYFQPSVAVDDPELAETLGVQPGAVVSRFHIDLAAMEPKDRAAIQEKLLRYHTPQMQAVSAEVAVERGADQSIEERLARLAEDEQDQDQ